MKHYLFLMFLVIGYCVCFKHGNSVHRGVRRLHNDQGDSIIYPCPVSDLECIRKFFECHGRCRPQCGSVPNTVLLELLTFPMTTSNISSTIKNAKITGLNGNITSFYINKKTDNLVIAFESKPLTLSSPEITFKYNRKGKEPIKMTDFFTVTYKSVTFTAIIPKTENLQLAQAYAYAYLDDGDPEYTLGRGLSNSSDPVVQKAHCDLTSNIPANGKESLVIQASNIMKMFIENKICNFGLHIIN